MPVPAARETDVHVCSFAKPATLLSTPHIGGPVSVAGLRTVKINKLNAATFGDVGECTGIGSPPPKDAIVGAYLKTFINGNPAAYLGSKTYGGNVTAGSPDAQYQGVVTALSEAAANWLHQYLAQQDQIPFAYPQDGCYARAHEMARIMREQFGLPVQKQFIYGNLQPATGPVSTINRRPPPPFLHDPITWDYHVAPTIAGVDAAGNPTQYVIDPSLSPNTLLTRDEWANLAKGSGTALPLGPPAPASTYAPGRRGGYIDDPRYARTKADNARRTNQVRNGEHADPDPNLASKITPKKSFPKPAVPPPHVP